MIRSLQIELECLIYTGIKPITPAQYEFSLGRLALLQRQTNVNNLRVLQMELVRELEEEGFCVEECNGEFKVRRLASDEPTVH